MATLTIYYGKEKPLKAIGKHQVKLLDFAYRFQCWHSYSKDRTTLRAINALLKKGYLELNQYEQFKFKYPN